MSRITGIQVQRNKAIVGQNAFAHEAGIHQDGMLKHAQTYEIMRPEDVGVQRTELVLGKHSGRHALRQRIKDLGYHLDDKALAAGLRRLQGAGRPQEDDLRRRHRGAGRGCDPHRPGSLDAGGGHLQRRLGHGPSAAVVLWHQDGTLHRDATTGDGPIDAVFKTIERITGIDVTLKDYRGPQRHRRRGRPGRGQIEAEYNGRTLRGRAVSTDIIEASALAFLQVINRALLQEQGRMNPQTEEVKPA